VDTYLRLNWVFPATIGVHGYGVIQVLLSLLYYRYTGYI